eukprot:TRINITY_DN5017_c0_g1_i4.p1 TRINITY_DN5017_c0_g1~~TRINITY_DN5017_c0_g1_i4.p1  ORF type:complete len:616 (+),score=73.07 TRINITY_DN5017_c0_g1_i4:144-1850(+)
MGDQHAFDDYTEEQLASHQAEENTCCTEDFGDFPECHIVEQKQQRSSFQQVGKGHYYAQERSNPQSIRSFRGAPSNVVRPSNQFHRNKCDLFSDDKTSYSFDRSSSEESCNVAVDEWAHHGYYSETAQSCSKQRNIEASCATWFEQAPHVPRCSGTNMYNGSDFWGANEDAYVADNKLKACDTNVNASRYDSRYASGRVGESVRVDHMTRHTGVASTESSFDLMRSKPSDKQLSSEMMLSRRSAQSENIHQFIDDCANFWGEGAEHAASHAIMQKSAKEGDIHTTERYAERLLQCEGSDALVRPLNIVLGACMKYGDLKRANYWWDRFVAFGVKPSVVTYNTMISISVRAGEILQAEWWIERLLQDGIQPCHVSFTTLIKAYGQAKRPDRAEYWFRRMRAVGLQGDLVLHNAMIDVYTKCSNVKRAENWFYEMQEEGVLPCQRTFNMLVHACAKSGNMKRASKWHTEMHRAGYRSDVYTYGALLEGCARCADTDLADYYIQCMCREGLTPNIVCLRSLLKVYLPLKDATCLANRLTYCMRHCGVSRHVIDQALASTGSRLRSAVVENL